MRMGHRGQATQSSVGLATEDEDLRTLLPIHNEHSTLIPCRRRQAIARAKTRIPAVLPLLIYPHGISAHCPLALGNTKETNDPILKLRVTLII